MLSMRREFLKGTVTFTLAQVLIRLRSIIILPVFATTLGAEGYGVFTQILVTVALLTPLVSLRLDTATIRFLSGENDPRLFRQRFFTGLVLILVLAGTVGWLLGQFSPVVAQIVFGDIIYSDLMQVTGFLLLTSVILDYLNNYFRITRQIPTLSLLVFFQSLVETVLLFWAVYAGYGVGGALWALIVVKSGWIIGQLVLIRFRLGRISLDRATLLPMIRYSLPLVPNSMMLWATNYADRFFITFFWGIAAIGVYSASYSLGSLITLLVMPVGMVIFPYLVRLWDNSEATEVRRYFSYVTRYYLLLALPAAAGLALVSQPLLSLLASTEFSTSTLLVFLIALGFVFVGLFQINVYAFHLLNKTYFSTIALFVAVILNVTLNWLLIPSLELFGAALATMLSYSLMGVIATFVGERLLSYRIEWFSLFKIALATMLMTICLFWLPVDGFLGLIGVILLGIVVYASFISIFRVISEPEIMQIKRVLFSFA